MIDSKVYSAAEYNQLLKLLATVIHKAGGVIRLDAADIHNSEPPKGFSKRWDNEAKQLVIELIEHGTALYITDDGSVVSDREVDNQWKEQQRVPVAPIPTNMPDGFAETLAKLKQSPQPQPLSPQQLHQVLDDERVAAIERDRRKAQALKEILEFQPPVSQEAPADRLANPDIPLTISSGKQPRNQSQRLPARYLKV